MAVADVYGGHGLEIIVADMGGNLVLVNLDGDVLWDRQLSGTLPHTPTVGDIDGDGKLDIVVVAVNDEGSHIWVLQGDTGITLEGCVMSQIFYAYILVNKLFNCFSAAVIATGILSRYRMEL